MTRRGSLAYYLCAWVVGCFVFCLGPWIRGMGLANSGMSRNLLFIYFIALIVGAADMLLYAFSLRLLMRWCRSHSFGIWLLAGASLAVVLTSVLAWGERMWQRLPGFDRGGLELIDRCVFAAPAVVRDSGLWVILLGGLAMGAILCLVDRAFSQDSYQESEP